MLLLQSTCPVATMELCCGFVLELRVFWKRVLGKNISAGPEHDVLWGLDNIARPCYILPRSSLFSHLPSLAPWLLITLADAQLCFLQDLSVLLILLRGHFSPTWSISVPSCWKRDIPGGAILRDSFCC